MKITILNTIGELKSFPLTQTIKVSFEKAVEEMETQYNDLINTCNDMSTDNERFIIFDKWIYKSEGTAMVTTNDKIEEMWHIELKEVK